MSYLDKRREHILNDRPLPPKKVYGINKINPKRAEKEKQRTTVIVKPKKAGTFDEGIIVKQINDMDEFWKDGEREIILTKCRCWECGDVISKSDFRNSTAHIFPKSLFPSIASNKWNKLIVGARCGCHNKTHRLDTFSQMKVFPVAVQRFLKFGELITEKHKYLDQFIEYANATI